jgi:hypothetical protein
VQPGLGAEIEHELGYLEAHWPRGLPGGVIHADLFRDNVFFLGDELSGIIDFYFACNDMLAYDVAICINAWCFEADGSLNVTKARALTARYQAVRKFTPAEIAALPLLARGSALRFLLTQPMTPPRTYCESVYKSTALGPFSAESASIAAVSSMRLFVVAASPPFSSFSWPSHMRIAPQPPGPGLPEHAPSLQIATRFLSLTRSIRRRRRR